MTITNKRKLKTEESMIKPINNHKCDMCKKSYKRRQSLFRPKNYECGINIGRFQCDYCKNKFKEKTIFFVIYILSIPIQ